MSRGSSYIARSKKNPSLAWVLFSPAHTGPADSAPEPCPVIGCSKKDDPKVVDTVAIADLDKPKVAYCR